MGLIGVTFFLDFAPPGGMPPPFAPTWALRGQSCQSPSLLSKSGRTEEFLPHIQLSPGERQLRAILEDESRAEAGVGAGLGATPGRDRAALGSGRAVRMGNSPPRSLRPGGLRAPARLGPRTQASAERTEPSASSPARPGWRGPGAAPVSGPLADWAGQEPVSGPRPCPAPLRSRPGRTEEEGGSARSAGGARSCTLWAG